MDTEQSHEQTETDNSSQAIDSSGETYITRPSSDQVHQHTVMRRSSKSGSTSETSVADIHDSGMDSQRTNANTLTSLTSRTMERSMKVNQSGRGAYQSDTLELNGSDSDMPTPTPHESAAHNGVYIEAAEMSRGLSSANRGDSMPLTSTRSTIQVPVNRDGKYSESTFRRMVKQKRTETVEPSVRTAAATIHSLDPSSAPPSTLHYRHFMRPEDDSDAIRRQRRLISRTGYRYETTGPTSYAFSPRPTSTRPYSHRHEGRRYIDSDSYDRLRKSSRSINRLEEEYNRVFNDYIVLLDENDKLRSDLKTVQHDMRHIHRKLDRVVQQNIDLQSVVNQRSYSHSPNRRIVTTDEENQGRDGKIDNNDMYRMQDAEAHGRTYSSFDVPIRGEAVAECLTRPSSSQQPYYVTNVNVPVGRAEGLNKSSESKTKRYKKRHTTLTHHTPVMPYFIEPQFTQRPWSSLDIHRSSSRLHSHRPSPRNYSPQGRTHVVRSFAEPPPSHEVIELERLRREVKRLTRHVYSLGERPPSVPVAAGAGQTTASDEPDYAVGSLSERRSRRKYISRSSSRLIR